MIILTQMQIFPPINTTQPPAQDTQVQNEPRSVINNISHSSFSWHCEIWWVSTKLAANHKLMFHHSYKVYKVSPLNDIQALLIKTFEGNDEYDFWSSPRRAGHDTTVMVTPSEQENFKSILNSYEIPYKTLIENVEV